MSLVFEAVPRHASDPDLIDVAEETTQTTPGGLLTYPAYNYIRTPFGGKLKGKIIPSLRVNGDEGEIITVNELVDAGGWRDAAGQPIFAGQGVTIEGVEFLPEGQRVGVEASKSFLTAEKGLYTIVAQSLNAAGSKVYGTISLVVK